jgi:thioredoxin-like negative regulator of GroEL
MEKVLGEQHPYVGITRLGLAETLLNEHEPQAAIDQIHAALALYTKSSSVNETSIAVAQSLLGECLVALEQFEEAEPILLDSHATLTSTEGESGEDTVKTIERIVQLYQAWGKQDEMACYVAMIPDRP